jgi:hypothetical protein
VKVGPGRLLVCGYDLASDLALRPVARQLRACLLRYMKGDAFLPSCDLSPEEAHRIFLGWEKHPRQDEWRISSCDSEEVSSQDGRARNVLDGDPRTLWHTEWVNRAPPHPHQITIDLGRIESVIGIRYLPRQDGSNGRVKQYQVQVSTDEKNWKIAAKGALDPDRKPKIILFDALQRVRHIRFAALSETNGNPWTSAAELSPVLKDS